MATCFVLVKGLLLKCLPSAVAVAAAADMRGAFAGAAKPATPLTFRNETMGPPNGGLPEGPRAPRKRDSTPRLVVMMLLLVLPAAAAAWEPPMKQGAAVLRFLATPNDKTTNNDVKLSRYAKMLRGPHEPISFERPCYCCCCYSASLWPFYPQKFFTVLRQKTTNAH